MLEAVFTIRGCLFGTRYVDFWRLTSVIKRKKMKIHQRLSEKVRGKIDKNNEAEVTCERLILVCQIANGALELILFFLILFKIIYYDKKTVNQKSLALCILRVKNQNINETQAFNKMLSSLKEHFY